MKMEERMRLSVRSGLIPWGGLIVSRYLEEIGIAVLQGVRCMSPSDTMASEVTVPQEDACWQPMRGNNLY